MEDSLTGGIAGHHHHHRRLQHNPSPDFCFISDHHAADEADDSPFPADDPSGGGAAAKLKASGSCSPWHRMKWTDEMVRLLIAIVAYLGDDPPEPSKKPPSALQKKGKWKSVSKMMLDKGCYVSPQQCEDKFNDLNKRYKRLNEILGRGTTCDVVENPELLDSMPHVSPKAKEDVRKILSSKHLFYREMCAYHNGQRIPVSQDIALKGANECAHGEDDEDDEDNEDDDDEEEEEGIGGDGERGGVGGGIGAKSSLEGFRMEVNSVLRDATKTPQELKLWVQSRSLKLQEERVAILGKCLEMERRRFKWQRFASKKNQEFEGQRLENERLMLENERMLMQLRQKELELGSSDGSFQEREHGRDPMEMTRA